MQRSQGHPPQRKKRDRPGERLADLVIDLEREGGAKSNNKRRKRNDIAATIEVDPPVQAGGGLFVTQDTETIRGDSTRNQQQEDDDEPVEALWENYIMVNIKQTSERNQLLTDLKRRYATNLESLAKMCIKLGETTLQTRYLGIRELIRRSNSFHRIHEHTANSTLKANKDAADQHQKLIARYKSKTFGNIEAQAAHEHVERTKLACEDLENIVKFEKWCQRLQKDLETIEENERDWFYRSQ